MSDKSGNQGKSSPTKSVTTTKIPTKSVRNDDKGKSRPSGGRDGSKK